MTAGLFYYAQYQGKWYAFYHNSSLSHNDWFKCGCVDKLYYHEDGSIKKVVQTGRGSQP
jgi:hypothetical protein